MIAVSIDDPGKQEAIAAIWKKLELTFPVIYDGGGAEGPLAARNGVDAIPRTFLIDRRGRVRYTDLEGEELRRRIEELLAER